MNNARMTEALESALNAIDPEMTLSDFVEGVFRPFKALSLRASTLSGYERDLRAALPSLGGLPVRGVGRADVQRMIAACSTPKAARNARDTLSSVFALACDLGLTEANPARGRYFYGGPQPPSAKEGDQGAVLTSFAEIRRFLEELKRTDDGGVVERAALLGLCAGLRKGEIFAVDGEDLDLGEGVLRVEKTFVRAEGGGFALMPPKTRRSSRTVPLVGYARERVCELGAGPGPWIRNAEGLRASPGSAMRQLRRWREEHGMPGVTLGSMRHSFATSSLRAGVPMATVSAWLGHSCISVTQDSYVRVSLRDLREDAGLVDEALRAPAPRAAARRRAG